MKSTIRAEALVVVVEATAGRVTLNGAALLPHEAALIGAEMRRAAERADVLGAQAYAAHCAANPYAEAAHAAG